MLDSLVFVALATITVCVVILLFSLITLPYWSWFFKVDLILFWLSRLADKNGEGEPFLRKGRGKWRRLYRSLYSHLRKN